MSLQSTLVKSVSFRGSLSHGPPLSHRIPPAALRFSFRAYAAAGGGRGGTGQGKRRSPDSRADNRADSRAAANKKGNQRNSPSSRAGSRGKNDSKVATAPATPKAAKNFATQTIWGQNVINCRPFSIDSQKNFEFLGSYNSLQQIPTYPLPEIGFVGRSNVGKSSLLNCITNMNKNIAVTSKTPGRTQNINLFKCSDKEGDICLFVDLPGYGFAKMAKTKQAEISQFLQDYLINRGALKAVMLLVDCRREVQELDLAMKEFLDEEGLPVTVIATKVDKLKPNELERSLRDLNSGFDLPDSQPIPFSAETGFGKKEVWRTIKSSILDDLSGEDESDEDDDEEYIEDVLDRKE